jgi:hypothetical protein
LLANSRLIDRCAARASADLPFLGRPSAEEGVAPQQPDLALDRAGRAESRAGQRER